MKPLIDNNPFKPDLKQIPLIFIHYGNSFYLKYVIKCAQLYNPHKQIILLGDKTNQHLSRKGVIHLNFSDYMVSDLTEKFQNTFFILNEENFRLKGKDDYYIDGKPGHFWQRFNWLRYFILYEFWQKHPFKAIWTFDSDNMIVMDLQELEPLLEIFDYCELHSGTSMQGLLKNPNALGLFCESMIRIFSNKPLLEDFNKQLIGKPPGYTFTEMAAFRDFQKDSPFHFLDGCNPFKSFVFDAVLSRDQGFEMKEYNSPTIKRSKRVFLKNGEFFFRVKGSDTFVQTINLDCSWMPGYIFKRILNKALKRVGRNKFRELTFAELPQDRIHRFFRFYSRKLIERLLRRQVYQ